MYSPLHYSFRILHLSMKNKSRHLSHMILRNCHKNFEPRVVQQVVLKSKLVNMLLQEAVVQLEPALVEPA